MNNNDSQQRGQAVTTWIPGHKNPKRTISTETAQEIIDLYYGTDGAGKYWSGRARGAVLTVAVIAATHGTTEPRVRSIIDRNRRGRLMKTQLEHRVIQDWFSANGQGALIGSGQLKAKWTSASIAKHLKISIAACRQCILGQTYGEIIRPNWAKWANTVAIQKERALKAKRARLMREKIEDID